MKNGDLNANGRMESGYTTLLVAIDTITDTVVRATAAAQLAYPGLPVLCSGGVASNSQLRQAMSRQCGAIFARPEYSTDNAMGVAILTHRALERGELV